MKIGSCLKLNMKQLSHFNGSWEIKRARGNFGSRALLTVVTLILFCEAQLALGTYVRVNLLLMKLST